MDGCASRCLKDWTLLGKGQECILEAPVLADCIIWHVLLTLSQLSNIYVELYLIKGDICSYHRSMKFWIMLLMKLKLALLQRYMFLYLLTVL